MGKRKAGAGQAPAVVPVAFGWQEARNFCIMPVAFITKNQTPAILMPDGTVRKATVTECERFQGFPVNYTKVAWGSGGKCPDNARYHALGNSMAVPVMRWVGSRIDALLKAHGAR